MDIKKCKTLVFKRTAQICLRDQACFGRGWFIDTEVLKIELTKASENLPSPLFAKEG